MQFQLLAPCLALLAFVSAAPILPRQDTTTSTSNSGVVSGLTGALIQGQAAAAAAGEDSSSSSSSSCSK